MKSLEGFVADILARHTERREALDSVYQSLENAGLISKVTLHRYICSSGCGPRATVIRAGGLSLMRTEDYKFSPGYNEAQSVESARQKRTLDGLRHWPKQTLDLDDLAQWGGTAQVQISCRHRVLVVDPADLLERLVDVEPGRPGAPTRL